MARIGPSESDFPPLYQAAEQLSKRGQSRFLRLRAAELFGLVIAALFMAVDADSLRGSAAWLGLFFFVLALVIRVSQLAEKYERQWYEGRAVAESVKSASWLYSVKGHPYQNEDAAADLTATVRGLLDGMEQLDVAAGPDLEIVTTWMKQTRYIDLPSRIGVYCTHRVDDQLSWYRQKAIWNKTRARRWFGGMVLLEASAVLLGLLRALGHFEFDWLGVLAAAAAGAGAWQQTKSYSALSKSYSATSHDVTLARHELGDQGDAEGHWAEAAHNAEAAFSREHTLWLARRRDSD